MLKKLKKMSKHAENSWYFLDQVWNSHQISWENVPVTEVNRHNAFFKRKLSETKLVGGVHNYFHHW